MTRAWNLAALCGALLLTLPQTGLYISYGLDPSWIYAINVIHDSHWTFGRDVIFTYGPLGYLLFPMETGGSTAVPGLIFRLVVHVAIAGILARMYWRTRYLVQGVLFALVLVLLSFTSLPIFEPEVELLLLLWFVEARYSQSASALWAGAVFNAMLLFVKLTLGLEGAVLLFLTVLSWPGPRLRQIMYCGSVYIVAVGGLAVCLTPGHFWRWTHGCMELAGTYSDAMSVAGPAGELNAILACMLGFLVLGGWLARKGSPAGASLLPLAGFAFLIVKHGIVRQDVHVFMATTVLAYLFGVFLLLAGDELEVSVCGLAVGAMLVLQVTISVQHQFATATVASMATRWLDAGHQLLCPRVTRDTVARANQTLLPSPAVPPALLDQVRAHETFTNFTDAIPYAGAYHLSYVPLPSIQDYVVGGSFLDELDASFLESDARPHSILLDMQTIDRRNIMQSAPALWRAILHHYEMPAQPATAFVLVESRATPLPDDLQTVSDLSARGDEWIEVPPADSMIYAFIDLHLNLRGKLSSALYRIPELNLVVLDARGSGADYRLVPGVLRDGIAITHLPSDLAQLADLFLGIDHRPPVVKFKLTGPAVKYYAQPFHVQLRSDAALRFKP